MDAKIVEFIKEKREQIIESSLNKMDQVRKDNYLETISDRIYENTNKELVEIIFNKLSQKDAELTNTSLSGFTEKLIKLGWPLSYLTEGLQSFRRSTVEVMAKCEETQYQLSLFLEVEDWFDAMVNELVNNYSGSWEQTVSLQKLALKELSAPLIPVFENISVMPLIGTIDTERAKHIMENLLDGVIEHRSEVVLIDITGVPVVDTMVAHHIIKASEAVRLVGAQCILVGIRPEIAQTIVNLGIDLGEFPTKSTLRKGIQTALAMTNKKIELIDS